MIPRILYQSTFSKSEDIIKDIVPLCETAQIGILVDPSTSASSEINKIKQACLYYKSTLIIQDDINLAIELDANAILIDLDADLSLTINLPSTCLLGMRVFSMGDIAKAFDENPDFLVLRSGSFNDLNIDPVQLQNIIQDCRIMGYTIPIIVECDADIKGIEEIFRLKYYGLKLTKLSGPAELSIIANVMAQYPIR